MKTTQKWVIDIDEAVRKRGTLSQEVACYFGKIATTLTAPVRREVHILYY